MTAQYKFIESIAAPAVESCKGQNLFPSVAIAQAILESNWGVSQLSKKCLNFFGIKLNATAKLSEGVNFPTWEHINGKDVKVNAYFRKFATVQDCFIYRAAMLKRVKAYTLAGVFAAKTPEDQAQALRKAGYATDPKYPAKLINIIATYKLKKYDA